MKNQPSPTEAVDLLGKVKAKISELCKEEASLKAILIDADEPVIEGRLFRATVAHTQRNGLDLERVKLFLTPEQLAACACSSDVTIVRVSAKTKS